MRTWGLVISVLLGSFGYAATSNSLDYHQLFKHSEKIPALIGNNELTRFQIPNPHWEKDACLACHIGELNAINGALKEPSDRSCFYCHKEEDHTIIHPVDLVPNTKMLTQMPEDFIDNLAKNGEMNCMTCHDIVLQCTKKHTAMSLKNISFLRGGYFDTNTGICYQCHDKTAYKRLNPHDQISEQGVVDKNKCLICHKDVPVQTRDGKVTKVELLTKSNSSEICLNCHKWQPHPGGNMSFFSEGKPPNHLVVPDRKIRDRLAGMEHENNLELPLEAVTGAIHCATCHNPHERGVISSVSLAKGASEKKFLRSEHMCINCHDM